MNLALRYAIYNDHILYRINEWSDIINHDIILKFLSRQSTPLKEFSF